MSLIQVFLHKLVNNVTGKRPKSRMASPTALHVAEKLRTVALHPTVHRRRQCIFAIVVTNKSVHFIPRPDTAPCIVATFIPLIPNQGNNRDECEEDVEHVPPLRYSVIISICSLKRLRCSVSSTILERRFGVRYRRYSWTGR